MIKNQQNTGSCLESLRESIKTLTNMLSQQVGKLHAAITNLTGEVQAANAKPDAQDSKIENLQQQNAMLSSQNASLNSTVTMLNATVTHGHAAWNCMKQHGTAWNCMECVFMQSA
jgi:chromosome segregation ATPase